MASIKGSISLSTLSTRAENGDRRVGSCTFPVYGLVHTMFALKHLTSMRRRATRRSSLFAASSSDVSPSFFLGSSVTTSTSTTKPSLSAHNIDTLKLAHKTVKDECNIGTRIVQEMCTMYQWCLQEDLS
jgi:hypothetical protein